MVSAAFIKNLEKLSFLFLDSQAIVRTSTSRELRFNIKLQLIVVLKSGVVDKFARAAASISVPLEDTGNSLFEGVFNPYSDEMIKRDPRISKHYLSLQMIYIYLPSTRVCQRSSIENDTS